MPSTSCRNVAFAIAGTLVLVGIGIAGDRVDFVRDVLPILSDKCYHCHGPDASARQADLRLDDREHVLGNGMKAGVVVPGKPAASKLATRIASKDADEVMPPPDAKRQLSPADRATLLRWIDQGAAWGNHWSLIPPLRVAPPQVAGAAPIRNPIDQFIQAALQKRGMRPSSAATPSIALRRLTLDLTGLPPTIAEIDAFEQDCASAQSSRSKDPVPDAVLRRTVNRLLASPRFGERMASEWLDVARFADTHGYQADRYRPMWAYRDWVIESINRNMPFDQFVTEQLAGDLLPNASQRQKLATAFNRLHMQNEEGGVVEEEFRVAYVCDRVNTFGTAFLGLTVECARCHDHKYDPITQRDYYSLFAFFQNIDECGQTSYFTSSMPVPTVLLSSAAQDAQLATLRRKIADAEQRLADSREAAKLAFAKLPNKKWKSQRRQPVAAFDFDKVEKNNVFNALDSKLPGKLHDDPKLVAGRAGNGIQLSGENGLVFPGIGHFGRSDAFSISIWVRPETLAPRQVVLHHSKAPVDAGSRGYELILESGRVAFGLHHMWPGNSLKVRSMDSLPARQWSQICVSYDGSSRAAGVSIYLAGQKSRLETIRDNLWKDSTYEGGEPDLAIGYRFRDSGFKDGTVDDLQIFNVALTDLEAANLAGITAVPDASSAESQPQSTPHKELVFDHFWRTAFEPSLQIRSELTALRRAENQTVTPIPEAMAMVEMPVPKPAFLLRRGNYDAPTQPVAAGTPTALPAFKPEWPRNRLGLAKWLVDRDHPLTARVAVNRYWQLFFGRGLVETAENFGSQGASPTHPDLLDWLARDFVDGGWDVKRLIRQIVTSATYLQASTVTAEHLAKDPNNELLARMPTRRLTAEMLRDQALFVSGMLVEKIGGPSIKPYQPDGLWEVAMSKPNYDRSKGSELYRRGLYIFYKRTIPHPTLAVFDAADRSNCAMRRQSTNTPLQSLALLNDPQFVEAARLLGQRALKEGGADMAAKCRFAFRLAATREPSPRELEILQATFEEQRVAFANRPAEARKLLGFGDAKSDPQLPAPTAAAATVLGSVLLNLDAVTTRP